MQKSDYIACNLGEEPAMNDGDIISADQALKMAQSVQTKAIEQEVPKVIKQIMSAIAAKANQGETAITFRLDLRNTPPGLNVGHLTENVIRILREQGYKAHLLNIHMISIQWNPSDDGIPF